jgi:hypothetical protein
MSWERLAVLAVAPMKTCAGDQSDIVNVLACREHLFDLARADSDSAAFFVSCAIEWASVHLGVSVLDSAAAFKSLAYEIHDAYREIPFAVNNVHEPRLQAFFRDIRAVAPSAFGAEWTPAVVCLYVRYFHQLQFGKPTPAEVLEAVKAIESIEGIEAARTLAFLIGIALKATRVHSIERQLWGASFSSVLLESPTEAEQVIASVASETSTGESSSITMLANEGPK